MKKHFLTALLLSLSAFLSAQINYVYRDGNDNVFSISETEIKYRPVTKEESSSGTYSGGELKQHALTSDNFKKADALFAKALAAKSEQQKNREMLSGVVIKKKGDKVVKQIILRPGSDHINKIEELLRSLL
jgi:hypothetical protein